MRGQPSSRLGWTVVAITKWQCSLRASPCLCRLPNSLPSRRTLAKYSRPAFWTCRRSVCINLHLAKLIVRTVRFGPAEPFFPAYVVFIEEMNSRSEGRCSRVNRL
jgi:hypothetical protein